jgi:pre-mRNA-splicing factor CDC5/CEF1
MKTARLLRLTLIHPLTLLLIEKEMLSEARARLANTQGKKAKRKARERQLEEARRLAVLQKKRELKAAGIIMRSKTKKKGMDYNADIPFEKKAAPGFYDTSEEQARATVAPVGQSLRRLENKRKPEDDEAERKKRQRRGKEGENAPHQTKFVAARDAQIQKLKEAESMSKRRQLVLPAAQVGENELEEIVKIGQAGENAKALVAGGSDASGRLMSEYEGLERARLARTPRTAPQGQPPSPARLRSRFSLPRRGQCYARSSEPSQHDCPADTIARRGKHSHHRHHGEWHRV